MANNTAASDIPDTTSTNVSDGGVATLAAAPAQTFMSTARVGIDLNGDIWQYQGSAGVVKVGSGAVPQMQSTET